MQIYALESISNDEVISQTPDNYLNEEEEEDRIVDDKEEGVNELHPGQCALYLAPSSLSHAGLGLYSGTAAPLGHSINEYIGGLSTDLFIPISDRYKALPYRGQQRFPSWLQYIWPEESGALADVDGNKPFPHVPPELFGFDTGLNFATGLKFYMDDLNDHTFDLLPDYQPSEAVNAFVPGIASLANTDNHAGWYSNIDRINENSRADFDGQEAPWHAGVNAFSPHHGVEFIITEEDGIVAGQELVSVSSIVYEGRYELVLCCILHFVLYGGEVR